MAQQQEQEITYGDQAMAGLKALVGLIGGMGNVAQTNPVAQMMGAGWGGAQGAANTPVGKDPMAGAATGAGQGFLTPYKDGVNSELKLMGKEEARKFVAGGGSAQQLEEHMNAPYTPEEVGNTARPDPSINTSSGPGVRNYSSIPVNPLQALAQMIQAPQNQQQTTQPMTQTQQQGQMLPATNMWSGGGVDANYNVTQPGVLRQIVGSLIPMLAPGATVSENIEKQGKMMDNAMKLQKLQGKEPLQAGEREKKEIDNQVNFFNKISEGMQKDISPDTSKLLGNINSGLKQISALEQGLDQDPDFFRKLRGPGNQTGQSIELMTEDLADLLGRLRSGGAINANEEKRFLGQIPKRGSFMNFENPKTAKLKLKKLRSLFSEIKKTSEPRSSQFSSRVQLALSRGYTKDQIYKTYHGGN